MIAWKSACRDIGEKEVNAGSSRRTIFERAIRLTHYGLVRTTRIARIYSLIRTATEAPPLSVLAHRLLIRLSATHPDLGSLHIDVRAARRLVTLSGDNLVVVLAQVHAVTSPGVEVVLHVDAASDALLRADRPESLLVCVRHPHVACRLTSTAERSLFHRWRAGWYGWRWKRRRYRRQS